MKIDAKKEIEQIIYFLKKTFAEQGVQKAVIGISGGIDSTTSLFLLSRALPKEHIFPIHLYYYKPDKKEIKEFVRYTGIPDVNLKMISIKSAVDTVSNELGIRNNELGNNNTRLGNIMARMRMIFLYDFAKKENALVVGTENKSEHYLAYFTRFGDEASDIEPIRHLYKIQVYKLAKYLGVPKKIIEQKPTAGLWQRQTDEGEFGFTYQEADQVLYLHFEKKVSIDELARRGLANAEIILDWVKRNSFKHHVPYTL
ncbi:MAG: NAD+ synthase [Candidatus Levybacteria bacterium]|nr:NAD+ synthase [Candidatus Levybacteria bacterium]